jgi:hypothetical protein
MSFAMPRRQVRIPGSRRATDGFQCAWTGHRPKFATIGGGGKRVIGAYPKMREQTSSDRPFQKYRQRCRHFCVRRLHRLGFARRVEPDRILDRSELGRADALDEPAMDLAWPRRAAVDEAGVTLHQRRAGADP